MIGFDVGYINEFVKPNMEKRVEGIYPKALSKAIMCVQKSQRSVDRAKLQAVITAQSKRTKTSYLLQRVYEVL